MQSVRLPPELCRVILLGADPNDLTVFCRVSRDLHFRAEAQHLLYRTVHVHTMRQVKSWCLAVSRRPRLASIVRSLSLQLPNSLEPADAAKIGVALVRCIELKELEIFHTPQGLGKRLLTLPFFLLPTTCPPNISGFIRTSIRTRCLHPMVADQRMSVPAYQVHKHLLQNVCPGERRVTVLGRPA